MKKRCLVLAIVLALSVTIVQGKPSSAQAVVKKFLNTMKKYGGSERLSDELIVFLSPEYFKSRDIDPAGLKVNNYVIEDFKILRVSGSYVDAKVYSNTNQRTHWIRFKMVREENRIFIEPSCVDGGYVDPWWITK